MKQTFDVSSKAELDCKTSKLPPSRLRLTPSKAVSSLDHVGSSRATAIQSVPLFNSEIFVSVDCEKLPFNNNQEWDTIAIAAVMMPDNLLVAHIQIGNPASANDICELQDLKCTGPRSSSEVGFWRENQEAYEKNCKIIEESSEVYRTTQNSENAISVFVETLKLTYHRFWMISDNPSFDIRILDNILTRQGKPLVNYRSKNVYLQPICSWSFRQALQLALKTHISRIDVKSKIRSVSVPYVAGSPHSDYVPHLESMGKHTPLYDAVSTILEYWELKTHYARSILSPENTKLSVAAQGSQGQGQNTVSSGFIGSG